MGIEALCFVNIGPVGSRRRLIAGLLGFVNGLVFIALAASSDTPALWRIAAFAALLGGALGYFQGRSRTCVFLAARDLRNLDAGQQPVGDPRECGVLRRQAREVWLYAFASAAAITAISAVM